MIEMKKNHKMKLVVNIESSSNGQTFRGTIYIADADSIENPTDPSIAKRRQKLVKQLGEKIFSTIQEADLDWKFYFEFKNTPASKEDDEISGWTIEK